MLRTGPRDRGWAGGPKWVTLAGSPQLHAPSAILGLGDLDGAKKSEVSQMGRGHEADAGQKEGRDRALPACSGLKEAPSALTVQVMPGNLVSALLSVEEAAVILSAT